MAKLVTAQEFKDYLKIKSPLSAAEDQVLVEILDSVEDMLERDSGVTFAAAATITDELHDGDGTNIIYAEQPIAVLNAVKLGVDKGTSVDVADPYAVSWRAGDRRIVLIGGYRFYRGVNNVWLSYDAEDNTPPVAAAAIKEVAAMIHRTRGFEGTKGEKVGDFWHQMVRNVTEDSLLWGMAVTRLHRPVIG